MASWEETMQQLVNEDYETLLEMAKEALRMTMPEIRRLYPNEHAKVYYYVLSAALGADGDLTDLEKCFVSELLDIPMQSVKSIVAGYSKEAAEFVNHLVDYLPIEQRAPLIMLIACVAACDETISRDENAFLKKLMEE
ncbi:MAG: hypothetical protein J6L87_06390 [Clostridia bacterium]|nr:hypothetical protein [Oscillospiraceae bacterium]MBP3396781.1 hypothetical protein [Clostridia bacterium]